MALPLPYDITLDGGVNSSHVQANFTTIANKFGTLVAADMPSLVLPTTQLSASKVEELIPLEYCFGSFNGAAANLTTGNKAVVGVHGSGVYTIVGARLDFNCTGGTAAAGNTFQILAGSYSGSGFTTTSTIVNSTSFYTTAVTGVNGSSNLTIATGTFTAPMTLLLNVNAVNGTPPTGGILTVTLRVTRTLQ